MPLTGVRRPRKPMTAEQKRKKAERQKRRRDAQQTALYKKTSKNFTPRQKEQFKKYAAGLASADKWSKRTGMPVTFGTKKQKAAQTKFYISAARAKRAKALAAARRRKVPVRRKR